MKEDLVKLGLIAVAIGILIGISGYFLKDRIQNIVVTGGETAYKIIEIASEMEEEHEQELNTLIKNGYTVYLDGEVVDAEKIDISLYKTSIDYDNKIIYATRR